jgi:phosphotransferase system  glucose/maltose/N-acetylglucosamine-specific IIC component
MDSEALRGGLASRSDESAVQCLAVIHPRSVSNFIWTVLVLAAIGAAAYFLVPMIGKWMSSGMTGRETMNRPSGMDVRDNLPNK